MNNTQKTLYFGCILFLSCLACICIVKLVSCEFGANTQDMSSLQVETPVTLVTETEEQTAHIILTEEDFVFQTKEQVVAQEPSIEETTVEAETTEPQPEHCLPVYPVVPQSMMNADLQMWLISYCVSRGIDPYLVIAICERESCCKQDVIGDNGNSYGIMQVQPRWQVDRLNAYGLTADDLLNAQNCIMIGVDILQEYFDKGYSTEYVLMCYNGGEDYAKRQTQVSEYAIWVMDRAQYLRDLGGVQCQGIV